MDDLFRILKLVELEVNSRQAKENTGAKFSFGDCRIFNDLFHLFFDLFRFRPHFRLVWLGPQTSVRQNNKLVPSGDKKDSMKYK